MDPERFKPTPIPRERRRERLFRLTFTDSEGRPFEAMVRNLSSRGLNAAASGAPPSVNAVLRVSLPDGRKVWGIVRWTRDNLFGVEFDTAAEDLNQPR